MKELKRKKKTAVKEQHTAHDSHLYVQISRQDEIRMQTLEAMKDILQILSGYESYKALQKEKEEISVQLKTQLKEINKLVNSLKLMLPTVDIKIKPQPKMPTEKKAAVVAKSVPQKIVAPPMPKQVKPMPPFVLAKKKEPQQPVEVPAKKEMSELEKLEAELSDIESKLQTLS